MFASKVITIKNTHFKIFRHVSTSSIPFEFIQLFVFPFDWCVNLPSERTRTRDDNSDRIRETVFFILKYIGDILIKLSTPLVVADHSLQYCLIDIGLSYINCSLCVDFDKYTMFWIQCMVKMYVCIAPIRHLRKV